MVTTNLPNVTGRFIHKSGNFGDLVEGDYVYMIDQRYSLSGGAPFKQLVLYSVNKIIYRQYLNGILTASYVTYTSRNKPTKSDVGLSAVANERQYSANNPPPGTWKSVWAGSASVSFPKAGGNEGDPYIEIPGTSALTTIGPFMLLYNNGQQRGLQTAFFHSVGNNAYTGAQLFTSWYGNTGAVGTSNWIQFYLWKPASSNFRIALYGLSPDAYVYSTVSFSISKFYQLT